MLVFDVERRIDRNSYVPSGSRSGMAAKVLVVLRHFSFELEEVADREEVLSPEQFATNDEIQAETVIVRIKLGNALGEVRRKEATFVHIPMKPEYSCIKFVSVFSIADFVSQPHEGPILVEVLVDRVLHRLLRVIVQLLFGQATGQLAIRTIDRQIESVFPILGDFIADIAKKPFRVLLAMITKAIANTAHC